MEEYLAASSGCLAEDLVNLGGELWASRRSTLGVYDDARCCAGVTGVPGSSSSTSIDAAPLSEPDMQLSRIRRALSRKEALRFATTLCGVAIPTRRTYSSHVRRSKLGRWL